MCQKDRSMSFLRSGLASFAALSLFSVVACGGASEGASATDPSAESEDAPFGDEVKTKTDKAIQDEIAKAAEGTNYTSESDYPFKLVSASLDDSQKIITQEIVRDKLAWVIDHDPDTDKPLKSLNAMSSTFTKWRADYNDCHEGEAPSPDDCAKIQKMNDALARNLRGIKVMYFGRAGSPGHVDGVGVSVIIVGRTPKGNLVGVRTIAIWT